MRDYRSGKWGFAVIWGMRASVFPRAVVMAVPNAIVAFVLGYYFVPSSNDQELADNAFSIWAGFTSVLFFVLSFRSNVAYNRWWEGGTLLQQTRGEWFNAYSSLIAFTSADPKREAEVEAYQHMLARLMSLLFCSALQQVSPDRNRDFDIIDSTGIDPKSLKFLSESNDRVEVLIQWIQRSTILNMESGVLPIAPPVMSRAFQEMSRGIVNLQNARKIADFPFPYPYAQTSIVMLIIHWVMCPVVAVVLLERNLAAVTCFVVVFFVWCLNYIALQLEQPFGNEDNDLPMDQMQTDWNNSVATLLIRRANQPPQFVFDPDVHRDVTITPANFYAEKGLQPVCSQRLTGMRPRQDKGRRPSRNSISSITSDDQRAVSPPRLVVNAYRVASAGSPQREGSSLSDLHDGHRRCSGTVTIGRQFSNGSDEMLSSASVDSKATLQEHERKRSGGLGAALRNNLGKVVEPVGAINGSSNDKAVGSSVGSSSGLRSQKLPDKDRETKVEEIRIEEVRREVDPPARHGPCPLVDLLAGSRVRSRR